MMRFWVSFPGTRAATVAFIVCDWHCDGLFSHHVKTDVWVTLILQLPRPPPSLRQWQKPSHNFYGRCVCVCAYVLVGRRGCVFTFASWGSHIPSHSVYKENKIEEKKIPDGWNGPSLIDDVSWKVKPIPQFGFWLSCTVILENEWVGDTEPVKLLGQ